ncbi:peptide ABC transporter ATP-binding protein, partial [Streptomyces sp. SID724]|nr:peptide ABC transporter ATP-binding protein [Streptomyces sp. SID724]
GCRFRTRCWKARERCELEVPLLAVPAEFRLVDTPARHDSACHFAEEKRVVPPEGELEVPGPAERGSTEREPGEQPGGTVREPGDKPGSAGPGPGQQGSAGGEA